MSQKLQAHLLLLGVVIVWGSTFVLVKDALTDISPLLFNLARMAIASVCLFAMYGRRRGQITRRSLIGGAVAGFFLAMGYQLQTAGLALTTPSKSAFLTGLTVAIVPLLSVIPAVRAPGSGRPGWNAYAGAIVALAGISLLTAPNLLSRDASLAASEINPGDLLTLGCAFAFALHLLALARLAKTIRFEELAPLQIGFCAIFMALSSPFLEHPRLHLSPRLALALLVAAALGTAAAFTIQIWAQQHLAATHTALILSAEPLFAWLTSVIFLRQGLSGPQMWGALLIMAGIGLAQLFTVTMQSEIAAGS